MRLIRRDWREAGLPVIALALVVSVFAVTSVGIFNERVWEAMQSRAARSLGGDLVLQSRDPIPLAVVEQALALGLGLSQQVEFPSMILTAKGLTHLVSVKAVDEHYPLRGMAQIADRPYGLRPQLVWGQLQELSGRIHACLQRRKSELVTNCS